MVVEGGGAVQGGLKTCCFGEGGSVGGEWRMRDSISDKKKFKFCWEAG